MTIQEKPGQATVRAAEFEDIPFMLDLGHEMFSESMYAERFAFNRNRVRDVFYTFVTEPACIALVTPHGMLLAEVLDHWFAYGLRAQETILFVSKDHRSSREGLQLLRAYIQAAKEKGATEIHISNSTGINVERVERLYERMGFTRIGGNYMMEVSACH